MVIRWALKPIVARSRGVVKMKVEQVLITPKLAQDMLNSSKGNRSIRPSRVDTHARQMIAGEWHDNGDTVRVYGDGSLQDGHHRLAAIVKSGVPMRTILVTGITKEAALTVDKGSPRSVSDNILFLNPELGTELSGMMATLARYLILHDLGMAWDKSGGGHAVYTTDDKRIEYINTNRGKMLEACNFAKDVVVRGNTMMSKAAVAALYYLGCRTDAELTSSFLTVVFTGYGIAQNTTADHLRTQLLKCASGALKWDASMRIRTAAKSLRSHLAGRSIKHVNNISYREGEEIARFKTE